MKNLKNGKRIFAVVLLGSFVLLTVFCNLPYRYAAYPGTPEWENLDVMEMSLAHHVPSFRIRLMSTSALLNTFLEHYMLFIPLTSGYPLDPTYWLGQGCSTKNDELYPMVQELLSRPDTGEVILRTYQRMPVFTSENDDLPNVDKLSWMEFLLALPPINQQFSQEEKEVAKQAVTQKNIQKAAAGFSSAEFFCHFYPETYTPGRWSQITLGEYIPAQWNQTETQKIIRLFQKK